MSLTRLKQGFTIGESYLSATSDIQTGIASGDFPHLTWALGGAQQDSRIPASAGSDLSINVGDTARIDIATTGWYQATVIGAGGPETGGDTLLGLELQLQRVGGLPIFLTFASGSRDTSDNGGYALVATPPFYCAAGDQLRVAIGAYVSNPANTWAIGQGIFNIVRVA